MKVEKQIINAVQKNLQRTDISDIAQLVFVFGAKELICDASLTDHIKSVYSHAYIMGCTTSGEIYRNAVYDNTLSVTAIYFEKSHLINRAEEIHHPEESYAVASKLVRTLPRQGLKHVFVLSEGICINGSKLVEGLRDNLPQGVVITGGLAEDGDQFKETYIIANGHARKNIIVIAAIYGDSYRVGYGSEGGWNTFGIERIVTKSNGTELLEIDGRPALDLYKEYLGDYAAKLPASGLLFPLCIRSKSDNSTYVRTILGINEERRSLIYAGEISEGCYCRMMKANSNNLIDGAQKAAIAGLGNLGMDNAKLALLISCIGRKLVLKQMVDSEIEIIRDVTGPQTIFAGFYSYGEISPMSGSTMCELHNQTMTVTFMDEV